MVQTVTGNLVEVSSAVRIEIFNGVKGRILPMVVQISIIFMYLHENNPTIIVRFSIPSKNFYKNNPKYYDAVVLSSFISGNTFLHIFLLSLSWSS